MKNFSFGFATFQIDEAGKGVLCYTIRNPEEDKQFVTEEGYVTDLKLINSMSSYVEARELHILDPTVRSYPLVLYHVRHICADINTP